MTVFELCRVLSVPYIQSGSRSVALDLVLARVGVPVGRLRQLVRVLASGTIAANVISGWPDPIAVGLHAAEGPQGSTMISLT